MLGQQTLSLCDKQKNNRAAIAEVKKAKASDYLAGLGGGQGYRGTGLCVYIEPQNKSYREERNVNNFQNGMLIFTHRDYRTGCIIGTWLVYSSYVCFLCVAVSVIMSPYMCMFYRMFSLFNVILLKSTGSLVRYIINIISFVAIKSAQKEQGSDIHRHHGSLFEDTFFLNFKNLVPLCLVSVNIYIVDFFQMMHDLVQKVKAYSKTWIRKSSPSYHPSILVSAS